MIYDIEVDVAVARPPTPANTRTIHLRIAVEGEPGFTADNEALLTAALMAYGSRTVAMPLATRIVGLTL
ncbi:hypothetical protein M2302_002258 [Micromonospora sp. A200]|uniref:hypothetical protein n=1 Tax=Micromonospora sp. A200 TaxID=2940568 RepID=UPI002473FFB3|nr:hypothetical protein [Micromonospora sp. A200]MDH6462083.1 hypothetical protein [Micromonospora sp. A200]